MKLLSLKFIPSTTAGLMFFGILCFAHSVLANEQKKDCYQQLHLDAPSSHVKNNLYIFVDQTTYLTPYMKNTIRNLVSDWGYDNERIIIARYSAYTRGQYTELMFDESSILMPSEEYLFHLENKTKTKLISCIKDYEGGFKTRFNSKLSKVLEMTNPALPKTDMLYSLQQLTKKLIKFNSQQAHTVLIISDGLENSDVAQFHGRKNIRKFDPEKYIGKISEQGLISNWNNAEIYMYGLGHTNNKELYVRPTIAEDLKKFWKLYFLAGEGKVMQLGTPDLLLTSIKYKHQLQRQ